MRLSDVHRATDGIQVELKLAVGLDKGHFDFHFEPHKSEASFTHWRITIAPKPPHRTGPRQDTRLELSYLSQVQHSDQDTPGLIYPAAGLDINGESWAGFICWSSLTIPSAQGAE